jgi:hypothetical protein
VTLYCTAVQHRGRTCIAAVHVAAHQQRNAVGAAVLQLVPHHVACNAHSRSVPPQQQCTLVPPATRSMLNNHLSGDPVPVRMALGSTHSGGTRQHRRPAAAAPSCLRQRRRRGLGPTALERLLRGCSRPLPGLRWRHARRRAPWSAWFPA